MLPLPQNTPKNSITHYFRKHFPFDSLFAAVKGESQDKPEKYRLPQSQRIWLSILKIIPWLCIILFVFSLVTDNILHWDLGSYTLPWVGYTLHFKGFLLMISVCGLIGYGTNYIAIKM